MAHWWRLYRCITTSTSESLLVRKHVISATLVLNDIFHCCPMINTLITLVILLATSLEYWTYLVDLHTMEYMINPNTKVCGIFIMYFAHQCFRTPSLAKTISMWLRQELLLVILLLNCFSILSICIFGFSLLGNSISVDNYA